MENEIWKPVIGYEGRYEVSNLGQVRSIRWRGGRKTHLIFHDLKESGYVEVLLVKNKENRYRRVHQLVSEAFIPNQENKPQIDHIDGDRTNNRAENLRWCTQIENNNNPITLKRKAESQIEPAKEKWQKGCFDTIKKPIRQYSLNGDFIKEWESSASASRDLFGATMNNRRAERTISKCCRGEIRQAYGFIWIYKGNENKIESLIKKNIAPKSIRVKVYFPDGSTEIYDSINKAAKANGMENLTIRTKRYNSKRNISWELLDDRSCYENRWGGSRKRFSKIEHLNNEGNDTPLRNI